ncbi:hypothetical protein U1Q18_028625 [Sarracenia purpurea var. burkii]
MYRGQVSGQLLEERSAISGFMFVPKPWGKLRNGSDLRRQRVRQKDIVVSFRRLSRHQRQSSLPECHSSVCFQRPNRCKALPAEDDSSLVIRSISRSGLPICRSPDPRSESRVDLPTSGLNPWSISRPLVDLPILGLDPWSLLMWNSQVGVSGRHALMEARELGCWDLDVGSTASESVLPGCISVLEASLRDDEGGVG